MAFINLLCGIKKIFFRVFWDATKVSVGKIVKTLCLVTWIGLLRCAARQSVLTEDGLVTTHEGEMRLLQKLWKEISQVSISAG